MKVSGVMFYLKCCFGLAILLLSSYSFASSNCTVVGSAHVINYGAVVVQRDLAIGQPITSTIYGGYQKDYSCTTVNNIVFIGVKSYRSRASFTDGNIIVYTTNLPGVGIEIGGYGVSDGGNASCYITQGCYPYSGSDWQGLMGYGCTASCNPQLYLQPYFRLIKIGAIQSGGLTGQFAAAIAGERVFQGGLTGKWYGEIPISFGSGSVTQVACSITTPSLTFPIGDILASSFGTSVGATPSAAQNTQNLGLNCDAGANINVSLQGTQNPDVSTTSVLALTGQGSADVASGVGVQLVYNGSPLVLNNRIVLKQSAGGQETFPITARYYQTKTAVTTGKANASATLDLTYQ
ncbi:fimbrial protein [Enterobacteriaceae bacterium C23F]